ncbi:MAG: DUF3135 domain-containing protein [Pseudomonadota bacterium]
MGRNSRKVDFEAWQRLAHEDPEGFERRRRELLESVIAHAPESRRQRLRGLQWRVDKMRERAPTPLAACVSLSDMMWEALAGKRGLLERLRGRLEGAPEAGREMPQAEVVPLRRRDGRRPPE